MRDLDGYLDAMATQDQERGISDDLWNVMIEMHEVGKERGDLLGLPFADVAVDVLGEILDQDLAAEFFAEEGDVGADDRTEVEQQRLIARAERGQEPRQRFGGMDARIGRPRVRAVLLFFPPP